MSKLWILRSICESCLVVFMPTFLLDCYNHRVIKRWLADFQKSFNRHIWRVSFCYLAQPDYVWKYIKIQIPTWYIWKKKFWNDVKLQIFLKIRSSLLFVNNCKLSQENFELWTSESLFWNHEWVRVEWITRHSVQWINSGFAKSFLAFWLAKTFALTSTNLNNFAKSSIFKEKVPKSEKRMYAKTCFYLALGSSRVLFEKATSLYIFDVSGLFWIYDFDFDGLKEAMDSDTTFPVETWTMGDSFSLPQSKDPIWSFKIDGHDGWQKPCYFQQNMIHSCLTTQHWMSKYSVFPKCASV